HLRVADGHAIDAKCRAAMGQSGSGNELVCGCEIAHDAISGNSGRAGADRLESPACPGANRTHNVALDLIRVVEHPLSAAATGDPDCPSNVKASAFCVAAR